MNNSNLSWMDNKVFTRPAPQARPAQPVSDTPGYTMPQQQPTGVSPYMDSSNTAPATYVPMAAATAQREPSLPAQPMTQPAQPMPQPAQMTQQTQMPQAVPYSPQRMSLDASTDQSTAGTLTRNESYDVSPFNIQGPPTTMSPGYVPYYLKTQIGKRVLVTFIFENTTVDRSGILREVGVNYIVLQDATGAMVMCDLYSIRFVSSINA